MVDVSTGEVMKKKANILTCRDLHF